MSLKIKKQKYYPANMPCPSCGKVREWDQSLPVVFSLDDAHHRWYSCECGTRWKTKGIRGE